MKKLWMRIWLHFNAERVANALVNNRIKPSTNTSNYSWVAWGNLYFDKYYRNSITGEFVFCTKMLDIRAAYFLSLEEAYHYKNYIAYKILKGDVERD